MNPRTLGARIGRVRRAAVLSIVGLLASVGLVLGAITPAQAGGAYVWNDYTGYVNAYGGPNTGSSIWYQPRNGTGIALQCWYDNQNRRWFRGALATHPTVLVWVEANWVGSQYKTPYCY